MQISITVDFFFEPNQTFWMCLQPHAQIQQNGDMDELTGKLAKTSNFTYKLQTKDDPADGLVPVPFPSDADIYLNLVGAAAGFTPRKNHRRTAIKLSADGWKAFEDENRDPGETLHPNQTPDAAVVMPEGPFARCYNESLAATWQRFLTGQQFDPRIKPLDQMRQMLTLAFWGGTRRRLPSSAAADIHLVDLMTLPEITPPAKPFDGVITNLHSLSGLLFRIGTPADAASLNTVTDLVIEIDDGAGPKAVPANAKTTYTVAAFFKSLGAGLPARNAAANWNAPFADRIYVSKSLSLFAPQNLGAGIAYRRKQEDRNAQEHPRSDALRLLTAVYTDPSKAPNVPTMKVRLYDSLQVVLTRYRDCRQGPGGQYLLQLRPYAGEQAAFYDQVNQQLASDPNWFTAPNQPSFYDSKGTAIPLAFVGAFSLPWFTEGKTLLFFGAAPDPPDALMLFPRGDTTLTRSGSISDPLGLRCEASFAAGLGSYPFDTIQVTGGLPTDAPLPNVIGANFAGQFTFELAQSATNIEGNVEVTYPATTDPTPHNGKPAEQNIKAADEYQHDLLNYNSLNVLSLYPGAVGPIQLNRATELYPVATITPDNQPVGSQDHYSAWFHLRYTQPLLPGAIGADDGDPAPFFRALYARMEQVTLPLNFNIEHTYGLFIDLPPGASSRCSINYPPVLPNDLTLNAKAAGKKLEKKLESEWHFCTVALKEADAGDTVSLLFHTAWLGADWAADKDVLRPFYIAAWRSVAELAYADQILITGNFLRFNFHTALGTSTDDVLACGFDKVDEFQNWSADVTAKVQPVMLNWLNQGQPGTETFEGFPVQGATGGRVGKTCTIVEFQLRVKRKDAMLPIPDGDFKRPTEPTAWGPQGQAMDSVPREEVLPAYQHWRATLKEKSATIAPELTEAEKNYATQLRMLLGASEAQSGGWIAPHGIVEPSGQVIPAICPAAFRPVLRDSQLGDGTFQTFANFFWAVDIVIRAAISEGSTMQSTDWTRYFDSLEAGSNGIAALLATMRDLALPVPNASAPALDPEVAACVHLLTNSEKEGQAFKAWLLNEIMAAPAIFGDSKAFLYSRLKGSGADGLTPPEFARLNFTKQLTTDQAGLVDPDRYLLWESLRSLRSLPSFGFLETLDDLRYRDRFQVAQFSLSSLEGLVEHLRADNPDTAEVAPVTLVNGEVHIPVGAKKPGRDAEVLLPSREPVTAPVHHFTGRIQECQTKNGFAVAAAAGIVLDELLGGDVQPVPVGAPPNLRISCIVANPARTFERDQSGKLEQYVLSSIFSIRGDEESKIAWNEAFNNDRFHVRTNQVAPPLDSSGSQVDPFLTDLTKKISPDVLPNLHDSVLRPEILKFINDAVKPAGAPQGAVDVISQPYLEIQSTNGGATLSFYNPDGSEYPDIEAYLLKTGAAADGCGAPFKGSSMILVINRRANVWVESITCVQQTRNLLSGAVQQVHFAADFATIAPLSGPPHMFQPLVLRPEDPKDHALAVAVHLDKQNYSMTQLVQELLFKTGLLDPALTGDQWRKFDLSISFHHRQMVWQWTVHPDDEGNPIVEQTLADHSRIAERNFASAGGTTQYDDSRDWQFDMDVDDYLVDFHWSSGSNTPFFSIDNVPVKVS